MMHIFILQNSNQAHASCNDQYLGQILEHGGGDGRSWGDWEGMGEGAADGVGEG